MVQSVCLAQYSNHQLYQAYLAQDMTVWQQYIASSNWDEMTDEEKKQLLIYEYGFTAYSLSHSKDLAANMLQQYEQHLQKAQCILSEGEYLAYMVSVNTYKLALDNSKLLKYARGIYDNMNRALDVAQDDPFVLSMKGNVEFFSPVGSKKRALEIFVKADRIYREQGTKDLWIVRAVQINIVQCLEKLGRNEEAILRCEEFLEEEPDLVFCQLMLAQLRGLR